eukprot:TRINITY_DN1745_c0_g1_i3.p1 TRINITY_DN1745_c0_g1~~TRINITY_DN1745_c0_g1_i3.p1  ORF type:complete len:149 (+),score=9.35 TRINITY_DN1745_c0_g1_i3:23-448(+)
MASYQQGTVCIDFKKDPTMAVQPEFKGTSILVKAALFAFVGTVFLLSASQMLPSGADSTLAISLKPTSTAPATRGSFSFFPHFSQEIQETTAIAARIASAPRAAIAKLAAAKRSKTTVTSAIEEFVGCESRRTANNLSEGM